MTAEEVQRMPMAAKVRKIKVLTPDAYALHAMADDNNRNGLVVDTILLHVASGGKPWTPTQ